MAEEQAELGDVAPGRGIGGDHLEQAAGGQVAHLVVQQHHRLGAAQTGGVEDGVGLLGHGGLRWTGRHCRAKRLRGQPRSSLAAGGLGLWIESRVGFPPPGPTGGHRHAPSGQFRLPPSARGRRPHLPLLQPARGGPSARRPAPAAHIAQGTAGEPAAQRRRPQRQRRRLPGGGGVAEEAQLGAGDPVPPGAGADAGLHRRAGRGRPGRHA
ncbi:hypothetical protein OF001_U200004 [Pseudomonas sp. OF001]|nr:hypothetical protein OF001_U200004 [Pseudomonas sp. OF001]